MKSRSPITTHILDLALGRPAVGVSVVLEISSGETWKILGRGRTNQDGRIEDLLAPGSKAGSGTYRLNFDTKTYFRAQDRETFYPTISILFELSDPEQHYHVPLLLSPYGYSTYRGT